MIGRRIGAVTLLVALISLTLPVKFALACSCVEPPADEKALEDSDTVFSGTVIATEDPQGDQKIISSGRSVLYTIEVDAVAKGDVSEKQTIESAADEASCGFTFVDGRRYLVFADEGKNGDLTTSLCSNTREMKDNEDIPFASDEPTSSSGSQGIDPSPPSGSVDTPLAVTVGIAAGLAIVGAGLVATRRRRA